MERGDTLQLSTQVSHKLGNSAIPEADVELPKTSEKVLVRLYCDGRSRPIADTQLCGPQMRMPGETDCQ